MASSASIRAGMICPPISGFDEIVAGARWPANIPRREKEIALLQRALHGDTFKGPWIQNILAEIKLTQGNPVAAQSLLEQVPLGFSSD
jgi:hypothetical protein